MSLNVGQVINNRYRIVKLLGQGGFGAVYKAWDINLEHPWALKENLDVSPDSQQQFLREAKILVRLTHPNLARMVDYFVAPGVGQYLVMDFVEGEDLQEKLDKVKVPLPEADVVRWMGEVCDVLDYLHQQNPPVIHRDIKPANIRITPNGRAVVVDFGLAKLYTQGKLTSMGARAVTPGFAPPEQYLMSGATEPRSDIYALGATTYALLSGQTPPESIALQGGQSLTALQMLNPRVSRPVEQAVAQAMQLNKDRRCNSASEFKSALHKGVMVQALPAQVNSASPPISPTAKSTTFSARGSSPIIWKGAAGIVFAILFFWLGAKAFSPLPPTHTPTSTATPPPTHTPTSTATPPPTYTATPMPTPTPLCGGNVSGKWSGFSTPRNEKYAMSLLQSGCQVSGTTLSRGEITSTLKGHVENGIFYFSESGSRQDECYWTASLKITGNHLAGDTTSCGQIHIDLSKQ